MKIMNTQIYTRDKFDEMSAMCESVEFYYLLHPERDPWSAGDMIYLSHDEVSITADFEAYMEAMDCKRYNETVLRDSLFKYTAEGWRSGEKILVIIFKEKPVIKEPTIGDKLVDLRVLRNMTRSDVARACRMNYNYLAKMENGKIPEPSIRNINKALTVFGMKLAVVDMSYKEKFI